MTKQKFSAKMYALPTTVLILGTHLNSRPNFMTLAWATRVNFKPPLIGIGVNKNHMSHKAIRETGEFSLNMPSADMVSVADYVGLVSARKTDKSQLFTTSYGTLQNAPLIDECPLSLELKVYDTVDMPTNSLFIGEIVESWCNEKCLTNGMPDIETINPLILSMPDNTYWSIGNAEGDAWGAGKSLRVNTSV